MGRLNFAFVIFLVTFLAVFIRNFPTVKTSSLQERLVFVSGLIMGVITSVSPLVVEREILQEGNLITEYGSGYWLFVAYFFLMLGISLVYLIKGMSLKDKVLAQQNKVLLIAVLSSVVLGSITNIIVPILFRSTEWFEVEQYILLQNFGSFVVLTFGVPITYSIFKYQFLDTRLVLGRGLYYSTMIFLLYILFYSITLIERYLWGDVLKVNSYIWGTVLAFLSILVIDRARDFLLRYLRKSIVNPFYDSENYLTILKQKLGDALTIEELTNVAIKVLEEVFQPKQLEIYVYSDRHSISECFSKTSALNQKEIESLIKKAFRSKKKLPLISLDRVEVDNKMQEIYEREYPQIFRYMCQNHLKLFIPIDKGKEKLGAILIGEKQNATRYNTTDIKFIQEAEDNLAWALSRAFLHEQVKDFNETLQQKVEEATKELQQKIKELEDMHEREQDMLDIMGHELRTPMTIIKNGVTLINMLIENDKVDALDPKVEEQVENIERAMRREIGLIEMMLDVTKLGAGKLDLNITEVDLAQIVGEVKLAFGEKAKEKGLDLVVEYDVEKDWCVNGDSLKIHQVVDNLVSNAIKYTKEGSVIVTLEEEGDQIRCSIEDTGVGISDKDKEHLGEKFYRANNYVGDSRDNSVVRPGGSGLGLYVVFGLVEAMGGKIEVESEVGEGSTFSFVLDKCGD
jgi:signal transduction histidine kinase